MSETRIDPELRELLGELARDPEAKLLRVQRVPFDLAGATAVSSREALLNAAERQLLAAYRSEVARLLRDASRSTLLAYDGDDDPQTRLHAISQEPEVPRFDEIRPRARRLSRFHPAGTAPSILRDCASSPPPSVPLAVRFALAAARMEPCPAARIEAAIAFFMSGHLRQAEAILTQLVRDPLTPLDRSIALENLASLHWRTGRWESALHGYRDSWSESRQRLAPLVAWLASALRLAMSSQALSAADALDDLADPEHPYLTSFPHTGTEGPPPAPALSRELAGLTDDFGPAARTIADALLAT